LLLNIITITKNDIGGLAKTIASTRFLREDYDINQVIIDSSDKDISNEIILFLNKEKNVTYKWQQPSGRSSAFNFGLEQSDSEWVWFLNGGDRINPDLDAKSFLKLLGQNNADAIIFQLAYSQSKTTFRHPPLWALWPPVLSWIPHPSTITRRFLYDKYGLFDESLNIAMDYEYWLRCFSKNVVVDLVSMPVAIFDETGISKKSVYGTKKEVRKIIMRYFWKILKLWFLNGLILLKAVKASSKLLKS
jgi:glycosyltransferase involved in cell wall biosynthesis